jgi:predicted ABC-type ATPase
MVVAGAGGTGKSTQCQRLAGTVGGTVVIDADILSEDILAVVSPNHDYPAFWRTLMRLAHEIAQNGVAVAYFGITFPEQILANEDLLAYFHGVHILGLVCDEADLRQRIQARSGGHAAASRIDLHLDLNRRLRSAAAGSRLGLTLLDASRPADEVEADVRAWIIRLTSGSN